MKEQQTSKAKLHVRNRHNTTYDLNRLCHILPELEDHIITTKYGKKSIDFFNPTSVLLLNKALLVDQYKISYWDIPENHLCPPIPGRADYIHYIADLLAESNNNKIPKGKKVRCLDIGTGAGIIYPILGNAEYGWSFVASEIDNNSLESAKQIIAKNEHLGNRIKVRKQNNPRHIFSGIFQSSERIDVTLCNPPFHKSAKEANANASRKLSNLKNKRVNNPKLNFGGQNNELWCAGGEVQFIHNMIEESKQLTNSCLWFTSLVSKKSNLGSLYKTLNKIKPEEIKTIEMAQGNKTSRFICWTFQNETERNNWAKKYW